jgi:predicted transcriptional regulator
MLTLTVKVPRDLVPRLDAVARRRRTTRSAVVREALIAAAAAEGPTLGELAADLIGVIDGPGDLSTNPAYLEDLGR